jgi:DNA-binding NarL/FixJ family response regulator
VPDACVIALSVEETDEELIACAEAGVAGFVRRDAAFDELTTTISSVVRGELPCSPQTAAILLRRIAQLAAERRRVTVTARLTPREREIVRLIDDGLSNKEIAGRLHIELATVKNHVHNILEKLQVHGRLEAAAHLRGDATSGGRI